MPEIVKTKRNKLKKSKRSFTPPISYLLSALKGLLTAFVLLGGVSLLLLNNGSFSPFCKVLCYACVGLGAFLCGFSSHRAVKGRGIVNGLVGGSVFCGIIILLIIALMRLSVGVEIIILLPVAVGCAIAGGITGANL